MKHRVAAVVAHYDPEGLVDPTFCEIVRAFLAVADRVVVVSTSRISATGILADSRVTCIERPNVGYDFYSYRVGFEALGDCSELDAVFFANSSFLIVKPQAFSDTLNRMLSMGQSGGPQNLLVGASDSWRMQHHLQSYLLLAPKAVLRSPWFSSWMGAITPKNSKIDVIMQYELGLSAAVAKHCGEIKAALVLSSAEKHAMWRSSLRAKYRSEGTWRTLVHLLSLRCFSSNPAHFAARPMAERLGIIKTELVRDNPHGLDLSWIDSVGQAETLKALESFVDRTGKYSSTSPSPAQLPKIRPVRFPFPGAAKPSTAVVVHAYYIDPLPELRRNLLHFTDPFDLFVTTPHEADVPLILDALRGCAASITVVVCENRGRDIGPFTSLLREGFLDTYSAVLKLHLKKSLYSAAGDTWRQALFDELCGNAAKIKASIGLISQAGAGIVGPHQYFLTNPRFWGANRAQVGRILGAVGAIENATELELAFFAGSMFWCNPQALSSLRQIPEELLAFPPEAGLQDGTTAHALERVFALVARHAGFTVTSLQLNGADMFGLDCSRNGVPVL